MKNNTQLATIKKILLEKGWISRNDCLRNFVTTRLGAYICDLQKLGWNITGEYVKTEYGKDYIYTLIGSPFKKQIWSVNGEEIGTFFVK